MKIAVVGMGYVGLSNAIMLSSKNKVSILEIDESKINIFNQGKSPIEDPLIKSYLKNNIGKITATNDPIKAFKGAQYILICTPTNYQEKSKSFDTSSVESIFKKIEEIGFQGCAVIRSTVPVGFTKSLEEKYPNLNIAFFPECLREGSALHDCLYPSRIICGSSNLFAIKFIKVLLNVITKKSVKTLITPSTEAESIKLFSNAYLAMRISFFNELDTFGLTRSLDSKAIIEGVCMDDRIGNYYNNPSFGYGGYCLPKDTKQLASDFFPDSQKLITATVKSNQTRKNSLSKFIINHPSKIIGIFKLSMKMGSDNFRESSQIDLIKALKKENKEIYIFEPSVIKKYFMGIEVINDFKKFEKKVELIIANRLDKELEAFSQKVFTRDIFNKN